MNCPLYNRPFSGQALKLGSSVSEDFARFCAFGAMVHHVLIGYLTDVLLSSAVRMRAGLIH
jgi:hypothetical protein